MATIPLPALHVQPAAPAPDPLAQIAKLQQLRSLMNEQQLQGAQLQGEQTKNEMSAMDLQDQQTMRDLAPKYVQKDDSGKVTGYDTDGYLNGLMAAKVNPTRIAAIKNQYAEMSKNIAQAGTAQLDLQDKKADQVYQIYEGVKSLATAKDADPQAVQSAYQTALQKAQALGVDTSKYPPQFPGKDFLTQQEVGMGVHKQMLDDAKTIAATQESTAKTGSEEAAQWKAIEGTGMFFNPNTNQVKTPAGQVMTPQMMESRYVALQAKANQGQPLSPEEQAFSKAYKGFKTMVPQFNISMGQGLLTGPAADMAAENYYQTGQLPAGARSPGMISSIINRAAQLHPGGNLAGNKAAFDANKASYDNVTKTLDTLSAFENAGLKNLNQFLDLTKKLPDTGVPWLNTPIRNLNKNLVGEQWMPAVDAARSTALREIARVTNDPKLSGTLTDSAREEVEGLSPQNATISQIKHVAQVLVNDMANVHQGLAAQKADIGSRLGIKAADQTNGAGKNNNGTYWDQFPEHK